VTANRYAEEWVKLNAWRLFAIAFVVVTTALTTLWISPFSDPFGFVLLWMLAGIIVLCACMFLMVVYGLVFFRCLWALAAASV